MDHFDRRKGSKKNDNSNGDFGRAERDSYPLFDCERVCVLIIIAAL